MATINSGILLHLIPRTQFTMTGLGNALTATVPIAQHVDATAFTEADLALRVHGGTIPGAATIAAQLFVDGYTFDDPATIFIGGAAAASITSPAGGSVPFYGVAVTSSLGRLLSVQLVFTQGGAQAAFTPIVSVDLLLKGGDPTAMGMMPNAYRGYRAM